MEKRNTSINSDEDDFPLDDRLEVKFIIDYLTNVVFIIINFIVYFIIIIIIKYKIYTYYYNILHYNILFTTKYKIIIKPYLNIIINIFIYDNMILYIIMNN